jgi:DNA mismatch repair protein MutS
MIIDDYLEYSKKYKAKYGDKCIVLMQVGSFFELYSIDDSITDNDIYNIADICNIQIAKKNKNIIEVSVNNPLMAGFPLYTLSKYTQILLNNNYTIVLIEQVTDPPNPERKVTEILSPGNNVLLSNKKSNYMMVLYYEYIDQFLIVGISGIDLSTGKTFIYEAGSTKKDPEFANDEVFRFVNNYNPSEIIIISSDVFSEEIKSYILKNLNLNNILVHYKWSNYEYMDIMKKIVFQKGILEKAFFSKKSMLSIIDVLNLEKFDIARISFCCLLQFAYEHNADIIKELQEPQVFENNRYLNIEFNSALQLNILGLHNCDKPLIDILNRCSTSFGCRAFKERLLMPTVNKNECNKCYDNIDRLLNEDLYKNIRKKLLNILDLERIKRKMVLNKMNPSDWISFHSSLMATQDIFNIIGDFDCKITENDIDHLVKDYNNIIDLEEATKYSLNDKASIGNFFIEGIYDDVDKLLFQYNNAFNIIKNFCEEVNKCGPNDSTVCKLENNDRDGYYILITKKRYENAIKINKKLMEQFEKKTLGTSTNYKLSNNEMDIQSTNICRFNQQIATSVLKYYYDFVSSYVKNNGYIIDKIINYITNIDIACCCARNAREYCYSRPIVCDSDTSYVSAENLRHPIIERIDESIGYVGNDIHIKEDGVLLYGINASGKSSFMKAIGLNIIMAQAGMFVAARKFEYSPYHHIFTRISGADNIYKGMSSFTVEMTELRNILQRCNKNSLVIGDEICAGTEFISALSIVASGIDTLVKKKASFIFATHLHELTNLKVIKGYLECSNIQVKHMHIHIDEKNRIVYDRKLQEGQGSSIYGIEVCKSLDMPNDFMKIAEYTRKEVQGLDNMIINKRRSRYNSKVSMDKCVVCGGKAEDTHHIKYQALADDNGYINDFHKNAQHNLVPLCKECHVKEHHGELTIEGYVQTSDGKVLKY